MTVLDQLYKALSEAPDDWATRSILADWFEDAGQPHTAQSVRWMVDHHKRPYKSMRETFHWFNAERVTTDTDPASDIPEAVYLHLRGKEGIRMVFRDYANLREADEDFQSAWRLARDGGWDAHA